jgi:hypothetical protein
MSKVMLIVGILLAAIGIALGLMIFFSPGPMQVYGLTLEVAALLLVGGVLSLGLGGVIGGLEARPAAPPVLVDAIPAVREVAAATAVVAATTTTTESEALSPAVSETIKALEKAKTDLQTAFEEKETAPVEPLTESVEEAAEDVIDEEAEEEGEGDGQLYVLEERNIRGHAARVLSDGTVEAETSEGWMRFENLEHLDEYLDAMEPPRA